MVHSTTDETSLFDLEVHRPRIDAALREYSTFDEDCPPHLAEAIQYALLAPGKRLRPQLVLLAAEACGGSIDDALPGACAVEMVHAYSLIHDDLPAMDDDDLRRGLPTCHKKFGEATAILAGDALLARAFEVLAVGVKPGERAARCCAVLANAAGATALVGGQAADLAAEQIPGAGRSVEHLEAIHRRKTGAMFVASLEIGAIVAGAEERKARILTDYGKHLGLAFQITDDLLDVDGREVNLGKRTAKDAERGKMTFPGMIGVEQSRIRVAEILAAAYTIAGELGPNGARLQTLARFVGERTR